MGPVVPDKVVKFRAAHLNRSREIPSEAVVGDIFNGFSRPEVVVDVLSSVDVKRLGVDVRVKFGDSRSNSSRDIQLPHL